MSHNGNHAGLSAEEALLKLKEGYHRCERQQDHYGHGERRKSVSADL